MTGSGRLALPEVLKWSGGTPRCLGVVGRPSRMCRRGREALPDVQEWSGGHLGCPGVVGWPSRMSRSSRKALPDVRVWSEGHLGCPGVVGLPSRMSESGRDALPDIWEWLGGPSGCLAVVGKPSRMSRTSWRVSRHGGFGPLKCPGVQKALPDDRETLSDIREWSGGPPGYTGVVRRPCQMSGSGWEAIPNVRDSS